MTLAMVHDYLEANCQDGAGFAISHELLHRLILIELADDKLNFADKSLSKNAVFTIAWQSSKVPSISKAMTNVPP